MCLKATSMDCDQTANFAGDMERPFRIPTVPTEVGVMVAGSCGYDDEDRYSVGESDCCDRDNKSSPGGYHQSVNNEQTASCKKIGSYKKHTMKMSLHNRVDMTDLQCCSVTLWQFLLELLVNNKHPNLIQWTSRDGEFVLLQAEEVAKLWGTRKNNNHRMNYDKLSRALRYYYQKNIIKKVHGHKFVYRFICLPEAGLKSCRDAIANRSVSERGSHGIALKHELSQSFSEFSEDSNTERDRLGMKYPQKYFDKGPSDTPVTEDNHASTESFSPIDVEMPNTTEPNCCKCQCHSTKDEINSDPGNLNYLSATQGQGQISHDILKTSPDSVFSLEALVHHSRHTINMQRLAQHINYNGLQGGLGKDHSPCGNNTNPQNTPKAGSSHTPLQQQQRKRSATMAGFKPHGTSYDNLTEESLTSSMEKLSNFRVPGFSPPTNPFLPITTPSDLSYPRQPSIPTTQPVQSNYFMPPQPLPTPSGSNQCVWMPVPVSMLNHLWQASYSGLGALSDHSKESSHV